MRESTRPACTTTTQPPQIEVPDQKDGYDKQPLQTEARMAALQATIEAEVAAVVQSVLGQVPAPTQPLMEAGLDSLGAVELRNALGSRFAIELPATVTFDFPTIAALGAYLAAAVPHAGAAVADPAAIELASVSELSMQVNSGV